MSKDQLTDLEWLILQIQRIDGCERTKAAALTLEGLQSLRRSWRRCSSTALAFVQILK